MRCYIYNVVNNHNMGMTELYIYLRKWNGVNCNTEFAWLLNEQDTT